MLIKGEVIDRHHVSLLRALHRSLTTSSAAEANEENVRDTDVNKRRMDNNVDTTDAQLNGDGSDMGLKLSSGQSVTGNADPTLTTVMVLHPRR